MAAHQIPLATFFCVSVYGVPARGIGTYLERFWVKIPDYFCLSTYERHDRAVGVVHRFRFVNDLPLNAVHTDVRVHFIEYWEVGDAKVQHFSWVTDLRVSKRNVYHLMRGGRARWKIENETFNTLKNQ